MNALKTKLKRILYNNGIYKYHKNNTNFIYSDEDNSSSRLLINMLKTVHSLSCLTNKGRLWPAASICNTQNVR